MNDAQWDTVHKAMALATESIARSECKCGEENCLHDERKDSALMDIFETNQAMADDGHPNPYMSIEFVRLRDAFTAPVPGTKQ